MRIYFHKHTDKNLTTYTFELLKYLAKKNGHIVCDSADGSDVIGISLTSFYELDALRVLRNRNPKKKIIVGGAACNNPSGLLRYADYVCLGQSFELFHDCKTVEDLEDKYYIVHEKKKKGVYSHFIDWDLIPLVQISKKNYSMLYSVGCRKKCRFCLMSWANKYQVNPNKIRIINARKKVSNLMLICNEDDGSGINRSVSDVVLKEYIANPGKYKGIRRLRLGVERVSQAGRFELSKPIKDNELKRFFLLTKKFGQVVNLFFIVGLDPVEDWESFIDLLPESIEFKPQIGIISNYFDPQPLTPMANFDLRKIIEINIGKIANVWRNRNGRVYFFRANSLYYASALFNSMLLRCHGNDIDKVLSFRKQEKFAWKDPGGALRYYPISYFFDKVSEYGLDYLINGKYESDYEIRV